MASGALLEIGNVIMQALKEELASAERRAEEERAAHNATKMVLIHLYIFSYFFHVVLFYYLCFNLVCKVMI